MFKLGRTAELPPLPPEPKLMLDPPPDTAELPRSRPARGCTRNIAGLPRRSGRGRRCRSRIFVARRFLADDAWYNVVLDGALKQRHGVICSGARPRRSHSDPRLRDPSRQRGQLPRAARQPTPAGRESRRSDRRARHGGRRSGLRPVPRLQWRFRCQRRVSAARRPIGLLSCGAAARLCLGCAGECHHVADRQGAFARRYRRRDGLLCGRQCAVSAAQSAQRRARQARRGARQGRRTREAALRQLPWTRRLGRAAGDPLPRADNTPTTSPSPCRCGRKVSARTVPTRWR